MNSTSEPQPKNPPTTNNDLTTVKINDAPNQATPLFNSVSDAAAFLSEAAKKGMKENSGTISFNKEWWQGNISTHPAHDPHYSHETTNDDKSNDPHYSHKTTNDDKSKDPHYTITNAEKWGVAYALVMQQRAKDLGKDENLGMGDFTPGEKTQLDNIIAEKWWGGERLDRYWTGIGKQEQGESKINELVGEKEWESRSLEEEIKEVKDYIKTKIEPAWGFPIDRTGMSEQAHQTMLTTGQVIATIELAGYIGGTVIPGGVTSWGTTIPTTTTAS
ncbi:hypothetical protein [Floridanema evergladense]|uniref:Uncharacterized protein n=1 Tax=Floridaenema evergladense BLCC-F167 TaxID=3153639 RepID=A0ABV4WGJ3_9CYAN